jgi:hypothetical protein
VGLRRVRQRHSSGDPNGQLSGSGEVEQPGESIGTVAVNRDRCCSNAAFSGWYRKTLHANVLSAVHNRRESRVVQ